MAALEASYSRCEERWAQMAEANGSSCSSARELRAAASAVSHRCGQLAAGWQRMQEELRLLPATIETMREMSTRTADLLAQFEAIEQHLARLEVSRVHRREKEWRQSKLVELEQYEAAKRREKAELESMLAEQAMREQECAQTERRDVFEEQFEAQRRYVLEHGLPDPADKLPHVLETHQEHAGPRSLAEVQPGVLADQRELDDFYSVVVTPLDEGPS